MLTQAAADAELGPHVRLLEHGLFAVPARDLLSVRPDCLGARRTHLFAYHAGRLHRPRKAAAAIEKRGPEPHRTGLGVRCFAELTREIDLLNRAGGADFTAE